MKSIYIFSFLLFSSVFSAQEKLVSKSGKITFEASVPTFEEVKATSNNATFVLKPDTGDLKSLVMITSFRFKIALMEEHFNENYIESDKFPKAIFRGKIDNFNISSITTTAKEYTAKGTLNMHGKSKDITIMLQIKKVDSGIDIVSNFYVNASDFDIDIPSIVKNKVSNKIYIKFSALLK